MYMCVCVCVCVVPRFHTRCLPMPHNITTPVLCAARQRRSLCSLAPAKYKHAWQPCLRMRTHIHTYEHTCTHAITHMHTHKCNMSLYSTTNTHTHARTHTHTHRWEKFLASAERLRTPTAVQELFPFNEFFADAPSLPLLKGRSFEEDMARARGCFRHLRTMFQVCACCVMCVRACVGVCVCV